MRTERGLDRLVTMIDAVVAIAITLLVLPLVEALGDGRGAELGAVLADELGRFGAFVLSFVVIARLWLAHHRIVEQVGSYDDAFVGVNLCWAFTIVLLPFVTQVIAEFGTDRLSLGLYVGTIAASSAMTTALVVLLIRRPALRRPPVTRADLDLVRSAVTTGLLLLALVLGLVFRAVNFYAMFLLFLSTPVELLVRRLRTRVAPGFAAGSRGTGGADVGDDDEREATPP